MFVVNEDNSIYATRGDVVFFSVTAEDNGVAHQFQAGDVLRVKVYEKKATEKVVLQKDFPVLEATESVEIFLTEEDTKLGEVISKPKDYWYEVELNPLTNPQTIIGYDEDGAKVFKLFPEGADIEDYVPDPEDFKVMDDELDLASTRPVQNQAITRAVVRLNAACEKNKQTITANAENTAKAIAEVEKTVTANKAALDQSIEVERARIDQFVTLKNGSTTGDAELADARVSDLGYAHENLGNATRINYNLFRHANVPNFVSEMGLYHRFEHKWRNGEVNPVKDCLAIHPPVKFDNYVYIKPVAGYEISSTKYAEEAGTTNKGNTNWTTGVIRLDPDCYQTILVRRGTEVITLDEGYAVQFFEPFYAREVYGNVLDTIYPLMRIGGYSLDYKEVYTPSFNNAMYSHGGFKLAKDTYIHCDGDANIAFHTYSNDTVSNTTLLGDTGWRKELLIPADTFGVLYFRKSAERPAVELDDMRLIKAGRSLENVIASYDGIGVNRAYVNPYRKGIAHRGYSHYGEHAPENTLPAFRLAKANGFEYVEFDVRISSDGIPVVCHDETVDRTSNGSGNVADMTLYELKALDFSVGCDIPKYAGTKMPTLDEAIATCKNLGLNIYMEIEPECAGHEAHIFSLVKAYGMENAVSYISFSYDVLTEFAKLDRSAPIGLLIDGATKETVKTVMDLRTGHNEPFLNAKYTIGNDVVEFCKANGVPVEVWVLDDTEIMRNMNPYIRGVTSEHTNYKAVMYDMEMEGV